MSILLMVKFLFYIYIIFSGENKLYVNQKIITSAWSLSLYCFLKLPPTIYKNVYSSSLLPSHMVFLVSRVFVIGRLNLVYHFNFCLLGF